MYEQINKPTSIRENKSTYQNPYQNQYQNPYQNQQYAPNYPQQKRNILNGNDPIANILNNTVLSEADRSNMSRGD
jgi:hypothetical protein